jgi:signal transduction histidine kinase
MEAPVVSFWIVDEARRTLAVRAFSDPELRADFPVQKEALALLRASLPATIELRQYLVTEVGTVLANPTQMHQVLMNLCINAEHAMRETGGLLEVRLDVTAVDDIPAAQHPTLQIKPCRR